MIFNDLSAFSQHFPAVFRGSPVHDVGRGKGLGKDAGAAQAGELRPWGPGGG